MKALLLVGGEGTRLRPLTCNTVKAMVPILNRPFLEHMVSYLRNYGITDIILTLCYLPDQLEAFFGDGTSFGLNLVYVMEESPLGTAGAVKNAQQYLDDTFLVFNGDIFTDIDLQAMLAYHRNRQAKATIALTPVLDPSAYGVLETEPDGRVVRFVEKPKPGEAKTNLINAGIYILEPDILDWIPQNRPYMFEHHLYPHLLKDGIPVYGYAGSGGYWIDIGTHDKYRQVQYDLLEGRCTAVLNIPGKGPAVYPGVTIEGEVTIGDGCRIGAGTRIAGPSAISENCIIEDGASITASFLWPQARLGKNAILNKCVIGRESVIGDRAVIGEGAVIGDHTSIEPGTQIAPGSRIPED